MKHDPTPLDQEPLGTLFGRLVDDGRDVARAEIALYKAIAQDKIARSRSAAALIAAALLLAIGSTVMLLIALGDALGDLFGSHALGALASGVIGFAIAGLLARVAIDRFGRAFAGEDAR